MTHRQTRIRGAQRPNLDPELLAQVVHMMARQLAEEAELVDVPPEHPPHPGAVVDDLDEGSGGAA